MAHPSAKSDQSLTPLALGALGGALLAARPASAAARTLLRGTGAALVAVAARPWLERTILAAGERRRRVALRSSVEIGRALSSVFAFFKDFENLPRVLGGLRSVSDYQDGRSHWEAYTLAGQPIEWDVVVTRYIPNSVIGFESVPGSPVDVRVQLRFTRLSATRTRLEVEAYFSPRSTDVRDALHALMNVATERQIAADLDHMRFYLEQALPVEPEPTPVGPAATPVTPAAPPRRDPSHGEPNGAPRSE